MDQSIGSEAEISKSVSTLVAVVGKLMTLGDQRAGIIIPPSRQKSLATSGIIP